MSMELEEVPMTIVVALDVHRRQITYKTLDRESGGVRRGRIVPATRGAVREWLQRFAACEAEFALEGTTGWRFVVQEIERAGHRAHLADPAETAGKRGRKRRNLQVAGRIDHNRACLSVARKLCRRAHHILRELGDQALAPVESEPQAEEAI